MFIISLFLVMCANANHDFVHLLNKIFQNELVICCVITATSLSMKLQGNRSTSNIKEKYLMCFLHFRKHSRY